MLGVRREWQSIPAFVYQARHKGSLTHIGHLPLQLASGYHKSDLTPPSFVAFPAPTHHLALIVPPSLPHSGPCALLPSFSCFPPALLPQLTWQCKTN